MYANSIIFSNASIEKVQTDIMNGISKSFTLEIKHIIVNTYKDTMIETRKILMSKDYKSKLPKNTIEQYEKELKIFEDEALMLFFKNLVPKLLSRSLHNLEELRKILEICFISIGKLNPQER